MNRRKRYVRIGIALLCLYVFFVFLCCLYGGESMEINDEELVIETITLPLIPSPSSTPMPSPPPTPTSTPSPTLEPTPTPMPDPFHGQSTFKSYENYKNITNTSSPQYALQQEAYSGDYGIRMVGDRYCVAMGSHWAKKIGTKLDIYLESGELIKVILGDNKQDQHTLHDRKVGADNKDVLEFIVDVDQIPEKVKNCGSFNCIFTGKVSAVIVVEEE